MNLGILWLLVGLPIKNTSDRVVQEVTCCGAIWLWHFLASHSWITWAMKALKSVGTNTVYPIDPGLDHQHFSLGCGTDHEAFQEEVGWHNMDLAVHNLQEHHITLGTSGSHRTTCCSPYLHSGLGEEPGATGILVVLQLVHRGFDYITLDS